MAPELDICAFCGDPIQVGSKVWALEVATVVLGPRSRGEAPELLSEGGQPQSFCDRECLILGTRSDATSEN